MYGFLNTHSKRKAFRKALDNAFSSGYDPNTATKEDADPAALGKTVTPVTIEQIKKAHSHKALGKPETQVVDMSMHKDWREKKADQIRKDKMFESPSKGASLFDELVPPPEPQSEPRATSSTMSESNKILDDIFEKTKDENEVIPTEEEASKSWEELFNKLNEEDEFVETDDDLEESAFDNSVEVVEEEEDGEFDKLIAGLADLDDDTDDAPAEPVKLVIEKETEEEPSEEVDSEVEEIAPKKPKTSTKKTTSTRKTTTTKKSTDAPVKKKTRNKKRKNKIKFDADIIGGW